MIPIPEKLKHLADLKFPSFVEIENLLPEKFLLENKFAKKKLTTGNTEYLKIEKRKKYKIWEKLSALSEKDFKNFKPLFDKINELFEL